MKLIIVVALALVALAAAAPAEPEPAKILRSEFEQQPDGAYNYAYESDDGIQRTETGEVKEVPDEDNKPHPVVVVRGSYSYINPEGKTETISYIADEFGYQPTGDSIPKNA